MCEICENENSSENSMKFVFIVIEELNYSNIIIKIER